MAPAKALRRLPAMWLACAMVLFTAANPLWAAPRPTLSHQIPAAVANLQPIDHLPGATQLELEIGLPLRNADALPPLLEEIYNPASTNFHHYLTPQQYIEKFGPAPADYQALIDFAQSHGLTVTTTFPDCTLLVVSGPAATIENTFHLRLNVYKHPHEARNFFAPDAEPSLDLNIPVLDIGGLDNFVVPHPMSLHFTPAGSSARPNAFTGSAPGGNFMGNDFRAAYLPGVSLTGTGQTVGLLEFDGYFPNDITAYENLAGLPHIPLTNVLLNSFDGSAGSNNVEVALDIDMAVSMAPGLSKIVVYEGADTDTILTQMANDTQVLQFSASWTYPIDSMSTNLFARFALQGQSFFNASGDSGAYVNFHPPASPTDVPYLTSVGGTTLTTTGPGGAYVSETVWNWFNTGEGSAASSGGISATYPIPSWQTGINMTTNKGSTSFRNLPDVAFTADNIYVIVNNGSAGEVGGTSAACPLWAAFNALVNQHLHANGGANAGFINPAVYAIGKGTNFTADFHDITTGNNNNNFTAKKFPAVAGYDLCTGWGTPKGATLISALANGAPLITAQPANLVVAPGASATFILGAVGAATLRYQWKFNGTNISQATNSSYTVTNAQAANQGAYSAVVSNSTSSATSSNATLTVNSPPLISAQPQNLTVPQGANATFTVTAGGSPAPAYQWQFNGANIALATQSSFTITNAQFASQGNYSVLVSNSGGTVASSNAVLTVNAPPMITTSPASHTLNQGGTTLFTVAVSGSPPLSYQWLFFASSIAGATNSSYSITNVQFSQAGNYSVLVTNNFGAAASSNAVLTVHAPPAITSQPQGQSLVVGNTANFSVTVTNSTPFSYQWLLNSTPLTNNTRVSGAQSSNLTISNLLAADAGNYQVNITNAYGSTNSAIAALAVAKATPILTWANPAAITYAAALTSNQLNAAASQPGNLAYNPPPGAVLNAGTNLLSVVFTPTDTADFNGATNTVTLLVSPAPLSVTASNSTRLYGQANPLFTGAIVGLQNSDNITANFSTSATPTNLPGSYPIVPNLADPNHRLGNYSLTLNNGSLTVTPAPAPTIISLTPNTGSTNGGDTVTISGASFENGATVNFGPLAAVSVNVTNATNIIIVTPPANAGMVDVILTNADGQTVVLTNGFTYAAPAQAAQLASQPTNQSVALGGSISFTVTATGAAPLLYQWLFNQTNLPTATNSFLSLPVVQASNAGLYQAIVSNAYGGTTSAIATLSVLGAPVSFATTPGSARYTNGQFILQITGLTGQGPIVIQTSTNFTDWLPIYTNDSGFGQFQFIDTNAAHNPFTFYRALTPAAP